MGRSRDLPILSPDHPMRTAVPEFPEARLRELADRYAAAVAAKRRRVWLGAAVLIVAAIAAGWMGDVNFGNFVENFWRFPAYFASIAQYDDVQVLVAAQAASIYATIRTFGERLRIAHENAALQKRSPDDALARARQP